jgi:hypothetical protein
MNIKIIKKSAKTALVEYVVDGQYQRVLVPTSEIAGGKCDIETLQAGAKYGIDMEAAIESALQSIKPSDVANELKRHNIYRGYELVRNIDQVRKAIWQSAGAQILTNLINLSNTDKEE